jgi:predicted nucleic acid-binding protein
MVKALFDTNVLIDYLGGKKAAKSELEKYADKAISMITWMEIQVGTEPSDQAKVNKFLLKFEVLPITMDVSVEAVTIRKQARIKLPDAIIWATARLDDRILITRNKKDFPSSDPGIRIPYVL